jgi:chemotaxis protein methyltransferase CheR
MPQLLQPVAPPPEFSDGDFLRFRDFFYLKTGIKFADNKRYFVDKRIHQRMQATGSSNFRAYFDRVRGEASGSEFQALVNAMTVNETYFYRELYQFECLVRSILPEVARGIPKGGTIRIWSMPCSTGEEPFSMAFFLLEHWPQVDDYNIEIIASDIDTDVLVRARHGEYSARSFQHVPAKLMAKYTRPTSDGRHQVIAGIRDSIRFTTMNLLAPAKTSEHRAFDVIFCRNLLIYFDDISRRQAAEVMFAALNPGGFVCLGHSESMSRISSLFAIRKFPEAIVYQKPVGQQGVAP